MAKIFKTIFCSQSMVAMILVLLAALTLLPSNASAQEQTLVMQIQDTQPKYFLGDPDQLGFCGDIYAELKSRLAKKDITVFIPTEYTPFKRILHNLEKGRADAYCGAAKNADREKRFIYSELPLYATHHVLMARIDDMFSPTSYAELIKSESRIGGLLGSNSVRHLLNNGVTRINDTFLNPDEAINALLKKQINFIYYYDLALDYLLLQHKKTLRILKTNFYHYQHWMIYAKSTPIELRQMMEAEIMDMVRSGLVEKFRKKIR